MIAEPFDQDVFKEEAWVYVKELGATDSPTCLGVPYFHASGCIRYACDAHAQWVPLPLPASLPAVYACLCLSAYVPACLYAVCMPCESAYAFGV